MSIEAHKCWLATKDIPSFKEIFLFEDGESDDHYICVEDLDSLTGGVNYNNLSDNEFIFETQEEAIAFAFSEMPFDMIEIHIGSNYSIDEQKEILFAIKDRIFANLPKSNLPKFNLPKSKKEAVCLDKKTKTKATKKVAKKLKVISKKKTTKKSKMISKKKT